MAEQGLCSRRKAEEMIAAGEVAVNGRRAALGAKVRPGKDTVTVRGKPVRAETPKPLTLLMHKPKGYVCTRRDPHHSRTVFSLLPPSCREIRLVCVGRLDKDSTGMLILTGDGALAQRLTHPSRRVIKRYQVLLSKDFDPAHIPVLVRGLWVEGEHLRAEKVIPARRGPAKERRLEIHLAHGRKREIRRLLKALGYHVKKLHRFQTGGLRLRGLGPGQIRPLKEKEIRRLFI